LQAESPKAFISENIVHTSTRRTSRKRNNRFISCITNRNPFFFNNSGIKKRCSNGGKPWSTRIIGIFGEVEFLRVASKIAQLQEKTSCLIA
jgi:hypothetical protein